jgi:outer membrane murein-binding lipoprotein Lpp
MGTARVGKNPIRRVVNMLQAMQKKIEEEGVKEAKLYEKYVCYCKASKGSLEESISAGKTKAPELSSEVKELESKAAQIKEDLAQHKTDRQAAKDSLSEANALREKEAREFASFSGEHTSYIAAIKKAVASLEKGMAGSFLQTPTARLLHRIVEGPAAESLGSGQQELVLAFLNGGSNEGAGYAPQSGEITGILKQMGDEMSKDLADATATEEDAKAAHEELTTAKQKEVAALTTAIEEKSVRQGDLSVAIVEKKNALDDTEEALAADEKFLADMEANCGKKVKEWEAIEKMRSEEQLALADTIKILNDDDALDLFKKALPSLPQTSFLQIDESAADVRAEALEVLRRGRTSNPKMEFIALALEGRQAGFDKIIGMIDEMVGIHKAEQTTDDNKKQYCAEEFDKADDEKKASERKVSDADKAIASVKEHIDALTNEIIALSKSIIELDKMVSEATAQRKEENAEFTELLATNTAAKDLILVAKNRMQKFYNPKLYEAPKKKELTEKEFVYESVVPSSFAQSLDSDAPPPPPESPGAYKKKSEDSSGVLAMMDLLVKDLDKETTIAKTTEKDAQADYETAMKDSSAKRAEDSKVLADKEGARAEAEGSLEKHKETKESAAKELSVTLKYIASLHAECDWLIKYYDTRKEARTSEVDSLTQAKAVLNGADYSFLQIESVKPHAFA